MRYTIDLMIGATIALFVYRKTLKDLIKEWRMSGRIGMDKK